MNCGMNGRLASEDFVDDIFVQPAASDSGVSLGAALLMAKEEGDDPAFRMRHLYYGPEFSNEEIETALKEAKIGYYKSDHVARDTAGYLARGRIVGWLQGCMEVGARGLGNRSILASPMINNMKDRLNREVKHREMWRPFCPSMKDEYYEQYIEAKADSLFMVMAFPVMPEYRSVCPAVVHVDDTARPQAVSRQDNARFWQLLDEFERLTGEAILINTSFNIQGEPIVCSPRDALRCFGGTGVDVLVMGDYIAEKLHV